MPLMNTEPASILRARTFARSRSRVHRLEPRPKRELFAISDRLVGVGARISAAAGPNVSSENTGISDVTPAISVGS